MGRPCPPGCSREGRWHPGPAGVEGGVALCFVSAAWPLPGAVGAGLPAVGKGNNGLLTSATVAWRVHVSRPRDWGLLLLLGVGKRKHLNHPSRPGPASSWAGPVGVPAGPSGWFPHSFAAPSARTSPPGCHWQRWEPGSTPRDPPGPTPVLPLWLRNPVLGQGAVLQLVEPGPPPAYLSSCLVRPGGGARPAGAGGLLPSARVAGGGRVGPPLCPLPPMPEPPCTLRYAGPLQDRGLPEDWGGRHAPESHLPETPQEHFGCPKRSHIFWPRPSDTPETVCTQGGAGLSLLPFYSSPHTPASPAGCQGRGCYPCPSPLPPTPASLTR